MSGFPGVRELFILKERSCPCGGDFMLEVFDKPSENWRVLAKPASIKIMAGLICVSCSNHIVLFETPLEQYLRYHQVKRMEVPLMWQAKGAGLS